MNYSMISIGDIVTPYNEIKKCPHNVDDVNGAECQIIIKNEYKEGIIGLNVGEKIDIMYWLDGAKREVGISKSHCKQDKGKVFGTFALRTPFRPNPIGLAKLTIVDITDTMITVRGLDCLNGTSVIDIKPSIIG